MRIHLDIPDEFSRYQNVIKELEGVYSMSHLVQMLLVEWFRDRGGHLALYEHLCKMESTLNYRDIRFEKNYPTPGTLPPFKDYKQVKLEFEAIFKRIEREFENPPPGSPLKESHPAFTKAGDNNHPHEG